MSESLKKICDLYVRYEACAKRKEAELAALRGFVKSMIEYQDKVIIEAVLREYNSFGLYEYFKEGE